MWHWLLAACAPREAALSRFDQLLAAGAFADAEALNALQSTALLDWLDPPGRQTQDGDAGLTAQGAPRP